MDEEHDYDDGTAHFWYFDKMSQLGFLWRGQDVISVVFGSFGEEVTGTCPSTGPSLGDFQWCCEQFAAGYTETIMAGHLVPVVEASKQFVAGQMYALARIRAKEEEEGR